MMTRTLLLAGAAAILSGCISAADPDMFAVQGFAPAASGLPDDGTSADQTASMYASSDSVAETATGIPLPVPSPNSADASLRQPVMAMAAPVAGQQIVMADTAVDALNRGITQSQPAQAPANLYASTPLTAGIAPEAIQAPQPDQPAYQQTASLTTEPMQAEVQPQVQELAIVAPPKKKSIFARMFSPKPDSTQNARAGTRKRVVSPKADPVTVASATGSSNALPGVRSSALFGLDEESSDSGDAPIELASAAGLARLAPNGLHLQTERVEVACFKPQLVRVLKSVERHYGRPLVVTSGYRSPKHNRRIGGASGSRHTSCEAADVQVEGVSKWQLAKYLRSMPGRGGVGTYCHTESVHIDIGNTRDWNWRCRRRK